MKILVVDDEYAFCKNLKWFLSKIGHQVSFTTNGEHALDLVEEERPELITLDIRMPGMNGRDVLARLREKHPGLPVIVISAIDMPDMESTIMAAGASAVLFKPINLDELAETIDRF